MTHNTRILIGAGVALAFLLLVAAYFASPFLALRNLPSAASLPTDVQGASWERSDAWFRSCGPRRSPRPSPEESPATRVH